MSDFNSKLVEFFNNIEDRFKRHFPQIVAETATEFFKESFIKKSWDGVAWQPYKNKAREPRRGSLMIRSNALFSSIRPNVVTEQRVSISAGNSRVPYARIHNEGGRISGRRNIRTYNNNNFMGKGKTVRIKAHSRTVNYIMPKRQFMGKSNLLLEEIKTRFKNNFKTI